MPYRDSYAPLAGLLTGLPVELLSARSLLVQTFDSPASQTSSDSECRFDRNTPNNVIYLCWNVTSMDNRKG
jgi:hypothetical protein